MVEQNIPLCLYAELTNPVKKIFNSIQFKVLPESFDFFFKQISSSKGETAPSVKSHNEELAKYPLDCFST